MAEYYKPYSAVSAVAPQFDTSALQRAGALFEKSLNSIRDKEIEDFKLAQEQEKYKNALGFQQRAEERDIAKIAEERSSKTIFIDKFKFFLINIIPLSPDSFYNSRILRIFFNLLS